MLLQSSSEFMHSGFSLWQYGDRISCLQSRETGSVFYVHLDRISLSASDRAGSAGITKISRITRKSVRTGYSLPETVTVVGRENMILSFQYAEQMV